MPHQCLKCGNLFPEGTTTILRGCPDCRGTRFFYTREPLTLTEREQLLAQTERDLPQILEHLTKAASPVAPTPPSAPMPDRLRVPPAFDEPRGQGQLLPDGRLLIKLPRNIQQRVKRAASGWDYEAPAPKPAAAPPGVPRPTAEAPLATPPPPAPAEPTPASVPPPETVRIPDLGRYEIDVQRLLERSPIVVQKDGTYLIHLPSLFETPRRVEK